MFVKKLVEKATRKHNGAGGVNGLTAEEVRPRLVFHYGVPPESSSLAYDPIQHILAISTRNGVIKLLGKDNSQALLQSEAAAPSKFLQFMENQGILLNVWNIDKKQVTHVHIFNEEITSFVVVQQSFYIYVGDCLGNVTVLKLDNTSQCLVKMPYKIPPSESCGTQTEADSDTAVIFSSPQPMAESKRVLIIFRNGLISLWGIQESKVLLVAGGTAQHSSQEPKLVVSASWACVFGSKVVVGYSSGDIFLWAIPVFLDHNSEAPQNQKDPYASQNVPLLKLNLGYKMDKVPIVTLRWFAHDQNSGHLYVNGFSDSGSSHSFQVIIINESTQTRTIKLVLPLTEPCLGMEIVSCFSNQSKNKQNTLVLLLRSGCLCLYDDSAIEQYLLHCQSKSPPTLPKQFMVTLPFGDSRITVAKLYIGPSSPVEESVAMRDQISLPNKYSSLLSMNMKEKYVSRRSSAHFSGFSKAKNLLVTGHVDGAINFWDASCPLLFPLLSIEQQFNESCASSTAPVTSLHFDVSSHVLVSGHQSGSIRIFIFKKVQETSESIFSFLQAKQGDNYTVHNVNLKGAIMSISMNMDSKLLAVGTDKGYVSVIQMEGTTILYQKQIPGQVYSGIMSLQFVNHGKNGSEKSILLVGMEDSSILALEEDSGHALSANPVKTKKTCKALLMHILDASPNGVWTSDCVDTIKQSYSKQLMQKQPLVLICSENAIRLYALSHVLQGTKKVYSKKKLDGSCCYASIIRGSSSDVGLALVFSCGKMEIRSLLDLAVLNEVSLRGLTYPTLKSPPNANSVFCVSSEGEILLVNGDQAMLFLSVLSHREIYRHLEYITNVYMDGLAPQEGTSCMKNPQKERKKGIFSMVVKDLKGNKTKHSKENDADDSNISEELSALFSTVNFLHSDETRCSSVVNTEDVELDIDDIDLEDTKEKHKGLNLAVLDKQKLGKKLHSFKGTVGKLKLNIEEKMNSRKDKHEEEKDISAVDKIKQKYGYATNDESYTVKMAESKLRENVIKLKAIGLRTSEMQNTAQTFSSMAKELLQSTQGSKRT
ncbi:WD40 [Musa troglodytarum]|uniref:WD40 n=1 Tax=Musa troglodytarum TaxID=320322 RepID=A0A9E7FQ60_9LILI|nr:WD40 [Musa troglodytarum]